MSVLKTFFLLMLLLFVQFPSRTYLSFWWISMVAIGLKHYLGLF